MERKKLSLLKSSTIISNGISSFSTHADFLVIDQITDFVPSTGLKVGDLDIPDRYLLADPDFDKPGKIDMLLGAEHFFAIIKERKHYSSKDLAFRDSVFGFIASGVIETESSKTYCGLVSSDKILDLDDSIRKFWEIEEVGTN